MRIKLIDFYADWCMPCKAFAPTLSKVTEERDIEVVKVDTAVDEDDLSVKYGIRSIPTVVILQVDEEGNETEVTRFTGIKSETELKSILDNI